MCLFFSCFSINIIYLFMIYLFFIFNRHQPSWWPNVVIIIANRKISFFVICISYDNNWIFLIIDVSMICWQTFFHATMRDMLMTFPCALCAKNPFSKGWKSQSHIHRGINEVALAPIQLCTGRTLFTSTASHCTKERVNIAIFFLFLVLFTWMILNFLLLFIDVDTIKTHNSKN